MHYTFSSFYEPTSSPIPSKEKKKHLNNSDCHCNSWAYCLVYVFTSFPKHVLMLVYICIIFLSYILVIDLKYDCSVWLQPSPFKVSSFIKFSWGSQLHYLKKKILVSNHIMKREKNINIFNCSHIYQSNW